MFFYFFFKKPYIAIIGDIKHSKEINDRMKVQRKLNDTLANINSKYSQDIASNFLITLGDEFQGLLNSGENTLKIIQTIERTMYPTQIRFGIGVGEITTDINKNMALGADGPGYYNARKAIDFLKHNEKKKMSSGMNICLEMNDNENQVLLINTVFELIQTIQNKWTDRQREIIWDFMNNGDNQQAVAKRLSISQPTVQKALSNGNYYTYKRALQSLEKILGEIKYE